MKSISFKAVTTFAIGIFVAIFPSFANNVIYSDTEFNLSDYTINTFHTGAAVITFSQLSDGGAPGAALQSITTVVANSGASSSRTYFFNNSFIYDTSTSGAIKTIVYSEDNFGLLTGATLTGLSRSIAVMQDGKYYFSSASIPSLSGQWIQATSPILTPVNFWLVTDLPTTTTDSFRHPDFSSGVLQFGVTTGLSIPNINRLVTYDRRVDNIIITITPVPEASTLLYQIAGLIVVLQTIRTRKLRSFDKSRRVVCN